ncbi:chaperone protein dnaJ [Trifolium repens]|nr:chaperone protein dnaJ [Trifolium repens]
MLLSYEMLQERAVENCSQLINKLLGASSGPGLETTRILACVVFMLLWQWGIYSIWIHVVIYISEMAVKRKRRPEFLRAYQQAFRVHQVVLETTRVLALRGVHIVMAALDADSMDMEIDLSNLGTVNTMFAALFSKLGVPIKTTVRPLPIGTSISGKVEKQCSHFFGVTITEQQAESGIVVRVTSTAQSKFKIVILNTDFSVAYFEQDANTGYGLAFTVSINFLCSPL